jgi:hypothetical protein
MIGVREIFILASALLAVVFTWSHMVSPSTPPHAITAELRSPDVISGVTVALDAAQPSSTRWRVEVCGQDVTGIHGAGLPIALAFDTPIVRTSVQDGHPGLTSSARFNGSVTTISLRRHPFSPPEPWHIVVVIDFAQAPLVGRLTVGAFAADITSGIRAASGNGTLVFGRRCDDAYAFRWSQTAIQEK